MLTVLALRDAEAVLSKLPLYRPHASSSPWEWEAAQSGGKNPDCGIGQSEVQISALVLTAASVALGNLTSGRLFAHL